MFAFSFAWIPIEYEGKLEDAKLDKTTQHWAFATTIWEMFNGGGNLKNASPDRLKENYRQTKLILPINEEIPREIHNIISDGWSQEKTRRFNTQLIFLRLSNVCSEDDYQFLQNEDSMSSTTSICTLSESSNTSHHNDETCSSSRTSSTCSLDRDTSKNSDSYTKCDFNDDFWKRLKLQRYVQELEFGRLIYGEKIGEGHYGTVRKGEIQFYDLTKPPCKVAIKTLKDTYNMKSSVFDDFSQEIDIMKVNNNNRNK